MTFAIRAARLLSRLAAEALRLRGIGLDAKARDVEAMAAEVAAWLALDSLAVTVRLRMAPPPPVSGVRLTDNDLVPTDAAARVG